MNLNFLMWHRPYNSFSIYFSRENLRRCEVGWRHRNYTVWWAVFGVSGGIHIQSWPWQRNPAKRAS